MQTWIARIWGGRTAKAMVLVGPWAMATVDGSHIASLPDPPPPRENQTPQQELVEHEPVCIGSWVASAGTLSDTLYYRAVRRDDGTLSVGYFAFFSEERPWGNNWMTWSLIPALAVDLVYSRALLVAPGLQRLLFGAGDVEGVAITYAVQGDGTLLATGARADDGSHQDVALTRDEFLAMDPARPTFYSDTWSHQLGGRGAPSASDLAYVKCYVDETIRPLPDRLAQAYHIEDHNRAPPAHVDRAGGHRVDVESPASGVAGSVSGREPPRG